MGLAVMRDISLMWLIFLTLIAVIPFGVLFFFAIKGMVRLRQLVKLYAPIALSKTRLVAALTEEYSQKIARPIIGAKAKAAQVDGTTRAIFARRKNA
jgi:hypothetical protein